MKDLWEKVTKIDMKGHGDVIVCMPYNFTIPQFMSDADYTTEVARSTSSNLMMERMNTLEKKVNDNNNAMMNLLQSMNLKLGVNPQPSSAPPPTFTQSYAGATMKHQGRTQHLMEKGGQCGRERSPSVKRRSIEEIVQPNKKRNVGKQVVTGSRTCDKVRKMKSPPADIFVYGVPRDTNKEDIIEDLAESEIQINQEDIFLMSKGNPSLVSYRISVKAEDLSKALDPGVWPLRVKVREFIHYKKRLPLFKDSLTGKSAVTNTPRPGNKNIYRPDGNIFNILNNDAQA